MSATALLVFARALGVIARAPGFSRAGVPAPARAGFAFVLALGVAAWQPDAGPMNALAFGAVAIGEVLIGLLLGFAASLVAQAAAAAGGLVDDLVGLRALPGITVAPPGFGGLWALVFVVAFFGLGGVDALVLAFAQSFVLLPLGVQPDPSSLGTFASGFIGAFLRLALQLAAPAIGISLIVQLALGALGRILPRFGNLTLGFPAAYAGVLLAAFAALAWIRDLGAQPLVRIWPAGTP